MRFASTDLGIEKKNHKRMYVFVSILLDLGAHQYPLKFERLVCGNYRYSRHSSTTWI